MPPPQLVHAIEPVVVLYVPATHAVHGPPFGPVVPMLQIHSVIPLLAESELEKEGHATQADSTVAPTFVEYFPAAQSVQTALPVAILYFPATQPVQAPLGPVKPGSQSGAGAAPATHIALDVLAAGEVMPAGQLKHVSPEVSVVLYVPGKQAVHK